MCDNNNNNKKKIQNTTSGSWSSGKCKRSTETRSCVCACVCVREHATSGRARARSIIERELGTSKNKIKHYITRLSPYTSKPAPSPRPAVIFHCTRARARRVYKYYVPRPLVIVAPSHTNIICILLYIRVIFKYNICVYYIIRAAFCETTLGDDKCVREHVAATASPARAHVLTLYRVIRSGGVPARIVNPPPCAVGRRDCLDTIGTTTNRLDRV